MRVKENRNLKTIPYHRFYRAKSKKTLVLFPNETVFYAVSGTLPDIFPVGKVR